MCPSEGGASSSKDEVARLVGHRITSSSNVGKCNRSRAEVVTEGRIQIETVTLSDSEVAIVNGELYGSKSVELFDIVDQAFITIVRAADDHLSNKYFKSEFRRIQFTVMARRAGKRGGTRMRMSKVAKKRAYCRRRKPVKRQQRKRKRDNDSEIEAAITRVRDQKGKKIKPEPSDIGTDAGTSLATSQDLQEFSDETSAGLASCPSDSTPGKKDSKRDEKGKTKQKRKKPESTSEASGDSKTTTEKTPARKSAAKKRVRPSSKRRRSSQKGEDQTQITKGNESNKPSESAGSGNMNKNVPDPNIPQKGEPTDAKEPCNDKAAIKETVVEEQHEEESSSSSG